MTAVTPRSYAVESPSESERRHIHAALSVYSARRPRTTIEIQHLHHKTISGFVLITIRSGILHIILEAHSILRP